MMLLIKAHIFVTKDQVAKHLDCNRVKIFSPHTYTLRPVTKIVQKVNV